MSNQNAAIEALLLKRASINDEKIKMIEQFDKEMNEIDSAIEQLSGKKVWDAVMDYVYDDENPNYIKSSIEN